MCRNKRRSKPAQLALCLPTWGGKRAGAGRKRVAPRERVSHGRRPSFTRPTPVHVTLRMRPGLHGLRNKHSYRLIARALRAGADRFGVRVIHHSVQSNHVHLIVEAQDTRALSRGMQGLSIRIAKRLNAAAGRRGKVLDDRYHVHVLRTPRETRSAVHYVLCNARKHAFQGGVTYGRTWLDPYSSAAVFDGWDGMIIDPPPGTEAPPSLPPHTWLLRVGWRRAGPLSAATIPSRRALARSGAALASNPVQPKHRP